MMFALILAVSIGFGCGGKGGTSGGGTGTVPIPKGSISLSSKSSQKTPKGATVESEKGVTAAQLAIVDEGLTQAFTGGKTSGWTDNGKAYNYALYKIQIPVEPCQPSPETKTPSFLVRGDNYDGSVYDQYNSGGLLPADQQNDFDKYVKDGIGVVFAAEMVTGMNTEGSTINGSQSMISSFVVCQDVAVLENGARFGAEHSIIAHYDGDYYAQTETHSTISHPLLPKQGMARGLVSKKRNPARNVKLPTIRVVR